MLKDFRVSNNKFSQMIHLFQDMLKMDRVIKIKFIDWSLSQTKGTINGQDGTGGEFVQVIGQLITGQKKVKIREQLF